MAPTSEMVRTCDSRPIYSSLAEDGEYDVAPLGTLVTPIPCRPEAVNISNVAALVDSEGKPHFKYVVEGANLFFTQQARFYLEKRKVLLFKDSSANKGLLSC
jgi:NAD-specific glutamate dehydrogenase